MLLFNVCLTISHNCFELKNRQNASRYLLSKSRKTDRIPTVIYCLRAEKQIECQPLSVVLEQKNRQNASRFLLSKSRKTDRMPTVICCLRAEKQIDNRSKSRKTDRMQTVICCLRAETQTECQSLYVV